MFANVGVKLLVQGAPQVGKTTVLTRLVDLLRGSGVGVDGFVTNELREGGRRVGFLIRDLGGEEALIAHQDLDSAVRVGRFGVDVPAFERVALPTLERSLGGQVIVVIDEIARMELASEAFVALLGKAIERAGPLVATVHVHRHPVTDALLGRRDVEIVQVTEANREELPERLLARMVML